MCYQKLEQLADGEQTNFSSQLRDIYRKRGEPVPSSSFIDQEDPTGNLVFNRRVSYKQNRLVLYSGHFFHSPQIPPAAVERLTDDPTQGRLIMHQFSNSQRLLKRMQ